MKRAKGAPLRPVDVPQSDDLKTVRVVVAAVEGASGSTLAISEAIGVSERHVRYRLQSARVLGFVDDDRAITARGRSLLAALIGSDAERRVFRAAVKACRVVSDLFPSLLSAESVDVEAMAKAIASATALSHTTAHRRARVLRSWRKQLRDESGSRHV